MVKVSAIVLFGVLALAPAARASDTTPAFVHATMCDAAAPITSGATIFSRQIRATVRPEVATRRPGKPSEARAQRRAPAARPAPEIAAAQDQSPAEEAEAVLRPAVHFCVTPGGGANPVRYT
ncbi:hypothetical protein [Roseomonas sp. WA12]